MSYQWRILDTGIASAKENMSLDEKLLRSLSQDPITPILHLYDWSGPSATYGYFARSENLICHDTANEIGLQLARRPTGGGMIFHLADWAFSILIPAGHPAYSVNTLENYCLVNRLVIEILKPFFVQAELKLLTDEVSEEGGIEKSFCMAKPTRYDVMLHGKKVCGGAQRRTRFGFLHQGTISISLPSEEFLDRIFKSSKDSLKALMLANTMPLLSAKATPQEIVEATACLSSRFKNYLFNLI